MSDPESDPPHLAWHALLGPLPAGAVPNRQPVAPPEVLSGPSGWAVAGWEQLVLHLSAGAAGSRTILVVLDGEGALLSGGDNVLYRTGLSENSPPPADAPALIRQDNIGGRFESDGSFHGTRWHSVAVDRGEEELDWESSRSEPSPEDVVGLRAVVAELMRRQPPRRSLEA